MSKEDNINFLKARTCVLKVNIHCDGCKKKVKKLLHKIEGVYLTNIDAEQGKVTVSGNVDPAILLKKLRKAGKHAELWGSKGGKDNHLSDQLQKLQLEDGKGQQKGNGKPQKGGGGGGGGGKDLKGQQPTPQQQMKGLQDMKLPQLKGQKLPFQKDQKSVKFDHPPEYDVDEESDDGDEGEESDDFDDDDDDFDDMDSFDDDFDCDPKITKPTIVQSNGNGMANDRKGGGGGGAVEIPVQSKAMGGNNGHEGGKKGGGGGNQNQNPFGGGKNGGGPQDGKNGGGNNNKGAPNGGNNANGGNPGNGGKKGGGKNDVLGGAQPMGSSPNMMGQGLQGMHLGQTCNMPPVPINNLGNIPAGAAVQGLPAGAVPPGYLQQGGMVAPEMIAAAASPYQQQYMAAMMQQQRMMMNGQGGGAGAGATYPPPAYGYGMPLYAPMAPPHGESYTNFFSDENPNSCSIV